MNFSFGLDDNRLYWSIHLCPDSMADSVCLFLPASILGRSVHRNSPCQIGRSIFFFTDLKVQNKRREGSHLPRSIVQFDKWHHSRRKLKKKCGNIRFTRWEKKDVSHYLWYSIFCAFCSCTCIFKHNYTLRSYPTLLKHAKIIRLVASFKKWIIFVAVSSHLLLTW